MENRFTRLSSKVYNFIIVITAVQFDYTFISILLMKEFYEVASWIQKNIQIIGAFENWFFLLNIFFEIFNSVKRIIPKFLSIFISEHSEAIIYFLSGNSLKKEMMRPVKMRKAKVKRYTDCGGNPLYTFNPPCFKDTLAKNKN